MKISQHCCPSMVTTSDFHKRIFSKSPNVTPEHNPSISTIDRIIIDKYECAENIVESFVNKRHKLYRSRLEMNKNFEVNNCYNSQRQKLLSLPVFSFKCTSNANQIRSTLRRTKQNSAILFSILATTILNVCCATVSMPYRTIADDLASSVSHGQSKFHSLGKEGTDSKHNNGIHNNKKRRCEPITIPLCQRIGYNMTSFPNGYGHERQEEAGLEVHQFYPLVEVNCYKHLKFFLCSMYTPICQDNYELPVMPCREVCLEARKNCAPLMQKYGFRWPDTLECNERLPKMSEQETTGNICAAPPDTFDPEDASNAPKEFDAEDSALVEIGEKSFNRIPQPPPVPPLVGIKVVDGNDATQCECKCTKPFYAMVRSAARVIGRNGAMFHSVQNVSNCAYACHSETIYSPQDRAFLNTWISVWSGICLTLSAFTVLTFLTDVSRFPYPERPIFFLSLCQLMVSLGFMLRVFYGHERVACDNSLLKIWSGISTIFPPSNPSSVNNLDDFQQAGDPLCLTVFVLIYFFGMSASAWWVVLSLSWVLAAVPHWSTEWIAKYSTYFHLFAWLTPTIQTMLVIAFNAVDGDPVSGICYVGNTNVINLRLFVLGPLIIYFFVGVSFLSIGFLNLWGIRSNLKKTHPGVDKTSKLTQLMSKIGIFSVLYTVPAIFVILVLFYEQHYRNAWEEAQLCSCAPKIGNQNGTIILLTLIKSASMLVVGWTSGVWILSAKTLQSWRRVFTCSGLFCDHETRRRRRQGYFPAINRLSGSGGCGGAGAVPNAMSASHANQLLHDDIQIHPQFQTSTLPYSMAGEHSLNRQYQHLILNHNNNNNNNNNTNSPFHHHHNQNHLHRCGGGDNCISPITYATNSGTGPSGTLRHFVGGMPEKV